MLGVRRVHLHSRTRVSDTPARAHSTGSRMRPRTNDDAAVQHHERYECQQHQHKAVVAPKDGDHVPRDVADERRELLRRRGQSLRWIARELLVAHMHRHAERHPDDVGLSEQHGDRCGLGDRAASTLASQQGSKESGATYQSAR